MSDTAAVQRVGQWWSSLDDTTKSMFEQIFAEQPELAVRVLSGGTVTATEETPSLDSLFGTVGPVAWVNPTYTVMPPTIDPEYPEIGTGLTVTYTVWNDGTDAPVERTDHVRLLDLEGKVIAERQAIGLALPQRGSESMQVSFDEGVPADGRYTVETWVNLEGAERGAPANEHGTKVLATASFQAGSYEMEAGPATARETFEQEANDLVNEAATVASLSSAPSSVLEPFQRLVARALTLTNAAIVDFGWARRDLANRLETIARGLDWIGDAGDLWRYNDAWPEAEATKAAVGIHKASLPFSGLPYSPSLFEDNMPALVGAAETLQRCFRES